MRPPVPDIHPPRSRKSSFEQSVLPSWPDPRNAAPATFFLTRNRDSDDLSTDFDALRDSMYGVQSLDETLQQASLATSLHDSDQEASTGDCKLSNPAVVNQQSHDPNDEDSYRQQPSQRLVDLLNSRRDATSSSPSFSFRRPSDSASSRPLTPLNLSNPDEPSSLPSSPKSFSNQSLKHLDDISIADDLSTHAIASGEEAEEIRDAPAPGPDNSSQLIMPSITMPSRRPFTEKGKAMGRFKVLIAGASGSGKTSIVRSIVQACEDIVHVDPFPSAINSRSRRGSRTNSAHSSTSAVSEIYASTKPYPSWWSDLEDSRILRRRKSLGDVVLERNLCFVDTPCNNLSPADQTAAIIQYMYQQLLRNTNALNNSSADFQNMLAGNGGSQVDAILYLISEGTLATDIECIRKLCDLTNVIPVISRADLLSPSQVTSLKHSFHKKAQEASIKPFLFGNSPGDDLDDLDGQLPFAVSSATSNDDDNMDASILMSPDYVQPLVSSELDLLVQKMFDRDNLLWMRHSAAKKLAQGRSGGPLLRQPTLQGTRLGQSNIPGLTSSVPYEGPSYSQLSQLGGGGSGYTLARIADYTRQEETMAHLRLAKWASDLQRSLQNERERYAALAQGERAIWLTERLSECVIDGTLVPITQTPGFCGPHGSAEKAADSVLVRTYSGRQVECRVSSFSPHDPLGVVRWADDLNRRGWAIVQIVSSFGVVGGLALLLAKTWGLSSRNLSDWPFNSCGISN
ncbi:hypothetical protein MPDQ_001962 [Monascus purpureus]|uniref:Septin-type G domain-containing protein n=1 Tax=Monascus purpureus TaxID=5098 RepID=A0A507QQE4_MONPU|nr:hypothetical protein MPDQ_001962 [Monascus purpureus]BDD59170.1 hypothetical protein MAP00_004400 [Monascus purpureus]